MLPSKEEMLNHFPHPTVRGVQDGAFQVLAHSKGALLEVPTGEGKTAIGMTVLRAEAAVGHGPNYYVSPTKTQVEQVNRLHPSDTSLVFGRSEYPCLFYTEQGQEGVTAQDSPCYMLPCKHRVDQITGKTAEEGARPCPYFQAKYEAMRDSGEGKVIVCTTAFFLMNRLLVSGWKDQEPANVVIDEAHRLADTARGIYEYTITDYSLRRMAAVLAKYDLEQAKILLRFKVKFMAMAKKRNSKKPSLMEQEELVMLLQIILELDASKIERITREAIADGKLDPQEDRKELKLLEDLIRGIPRFINSLKYSLEDDERHALNYVVAFYYKVEDLANPKRGARYYLTFKAYYVAPLIRRALGGNLVCMSATIGNNEIFSHETGIKLPFHKFGSTFSWENTRIFMPTDTPSLAMREVKKRRDNPKTAMRMVIRAAKGLADAGHRSLIVAISDEERVKLLELAERAELEALSYGNGVLARDVAVRFRDGEGMALIGTAAHYAEGIDLPRQIAPVIFFLRPGYARPDDPQTQFEQRRFSDGHCWALWNWRVMIQALQVRGRNVRSVEDVGVTYFISQQFRRFVFASLPLWLERSYVGNMTMEEAVKETCEILKQRA